MKKVGILLVFLGVVFITPLFIQCGGDNGVEIDCNKICKKEVECGKESDESKCVSDCNAKKDKTKKYLQEVFIEGTMACYDKVCNEIDQCIEDTAAKCKAVDPSKYFDAACSKEASCDSNINKDSCITTSKSGWDQMLKQTKVPNCFTESFYTDASNCYTNAKCESLNDDVNKCLQDMGFGISGEGSDK